MTSRYLKWLFALVTLSVTGFANVASADDVKTMMVNAIKEAVFDRVQDFEKSTGHKVTLIMGGTESLTKRVDGGETTDIILVTSTNIDRLIGQNKVVAGSRADIAKVGVGVAVRSGLPKPDVSTVEGLKNAVLSAKSVAYSTGRSGFYIAELLKRMGIAEQVKDKTVQPPSGAQVGELIARGDADFGFQQISELIHVRGIDYLGPLPKEIQNITTYSAGLHAAAPSPEAAKALIKFLTAPESAPAIRKMGMEPG